MTLLYADTSAVVRAYFADEADHAVLHKLLLGGADPVVTSELTRLEFASAVSAAHRAQRSIQLQAALDLFDADCGEDGPFTLIRLDPAVVLPMARRLVAQHAVRTLDAVHLAVALTDAVALAAGEPVVLATRDQQQATAANACGLSVI